MTAELSTVRDFLRYAVSHFRQAGVVHGHGTSSVIDEAAFIILEGLHLPVDDINPWLDATLLASERHQLTELIGQRVTTRKPAAYLLNRIYLQGLPFYVDERVIIPRSYIAEIMQRDAATLFGDNNIESVLELCTGSGCLAVLAANIFSESTITATDISTDALDVARRNVNDHGLRERIELLQGDLFQPVKARTFDLIIANPPYVAQAEVDAFPPEYKAEPQLAHLGGADGLDLVRRILRDAHKHLNKGGSLICEIGTGRHVIEAEFPELDLLWLDSEEGEGEVFLLRR